MLMEDIEVKVYRSSIKLPMIFFVPATILLTFYVLLYLTLNSQWFLHETTTGLTRELPGRFAAADLVVEPWLTDIHLWGAEIDGRDGSKVIRAEEVHATLDPLALLTRRILLSRGEIRNGGFDMRMEGDDNVMNLLDAFGLEGPDDPEEDDDGAALIKSLGFHNLSCENCYYSFWMDILQFRVPNVTVEKAELDVVDGVLFIRTDHLEIPRADFDFSHWLYYFPVEAGNWRPSAENIVIDNWVWAGDGFNVERVYTEVDGLEAVAGGSMNFPPKQNPWEKRQMLYTARGEFRIHPWARAGQYFVEDLFHIDSHRVQIDVDGSLNEIEGDASFSIAALDAYGVQVTNLEGTAVLHDELVVVDKATGHLHGGEIALQNMFFDMYEGRFGGDATFENVDPMGVARDMELDKPYLEGRASGGVSVVGRVPYDEEYGKETSPFVAMNEFLYPTVEVTVTDEVVFERTGVMDTLPGRVFRVQPGTKFWSTQDHLGVDDATIVADHVRIDIDDFVFDWERYEVIRDARGRHARLRLRSPRLGALAKSYGGSGVDGNLNADIDFVGRMNYPSANFDIEIARPTVNAGGLKIQGERLTARGDLEDGRVTFADAAFKSELGAARVTGWLDALVDPGNRKDEFGDPYSEFIVDPRNRADLDITVRGLDLAETTKQLELDLAGSANGSLRLQGSLYDPTATFDANIINGSVLGQTLQSAELAGSIANKTYTVDRFLVDAGTAGRIAGSAAIGFDDSLVLEVRGEDISLAEIEPLSRAGVDVNGHVEFFFTGDGTLDRPLIRGDTRIDDLRIGDRKLGNLALVANTIGDTTHLAGALLPWVTVDVEIPLDGESALYARLGIDHLDLVDAIAELRRAKPIQRAEATGTLELFMEPDLSRYQILANLTEIDVRALDKTFVNEGPIIAGLNDGQLVQIQQAAIKTQDRLVKMRGAISLDEAFVDVEVDGDVDLSLLTGFRLSFPEYFPDSFLESNGVVDVDAAVKGSPGEFVARGTVDFRPSQFLLRDLSDPLELQEGRIVFGRDGVNIPSNAPLRGRALGGYFAASGAVLLDGFKPRSVDARIRTQGMSYRLPEVANLTFDSELRLNAQDMERPDTWLVSGDVDVLDGLYYENISLFQQQLTNRLIGAFSRSTERYEASLVERFPALEEMSFDVAIRARDGFRVRNEIDRLALDLEFRVDVRVQNTLPNPQVTGDVDVIDGRVTFQGEAFEVRSGTLSFSGDPDNPYVDISARADIFNTCRDTDVAADSSQTMSLSGVVDSGEQKSFHVTLNVQGRMDTLDIEFESIPYADQRDILSLLLTGCTVDQLTASSASSPTLEVALGPVLGWIEGQVQDVVEVEEFTITPSVDRLKATVGDSISRRMRWRLQLDTGLSEVATGQRFQLEYRLSDHWSARASESSTDSSQFDSFLLDFKLRYRILLD